ncbi:type IV secretion system lytic transglycosylase VirB1 [Suttonella ornithocola]|uniref:Type IV secretion system lytic transglycosylase VirB1 n=2 Tax=Suttonella ornithocola TaxID=279832 RepID=A0A380MXL4_9GAMM|nr:type IV secretion system lytic transglycosylase VirB1 [Suttonella ornithocola]
MFEFLGCPIVVPPEQMSAIVRTESSANPYAIGIVGHYLSRQPSNENEALAVVTALKDGDYNYSVGLSQINKINFYRYLSFSKLFDKCSNLLAGSKILKACYERLKDWGQAYSCYYSGDSITGFKHGYVAKVKQNYTKPILQVVAIPSASSAPIKLISRKNKNSNDESLVKPPSLKQRRLNASLSSIDS